MNKRFIFITGMYKLVRQTIQELATSLPGIVFFPASENSWWEKAILKPWEASQVVYEQLMYKEFEQDDLILKTLAHSNCVIVEQWHLGNIAGARLRSAELGELYLTRFRQHLSRFNDIQIEEFYISTDVEKLSETASLARDLYRSWLQELAALTRDFNFSLQTIDGEASPQAIKQRLLYLLA